MAPGRQHYWKADFLGTQNDPKGSGYQHLSDEAIDRLASIKAKFDPENLFRLNANVRPARS